MEDDLVGDERNFLHKLTNVLAIAHGSVHAVRSMQKRGDAEIDPTVLGRRLTTACNALDEMVQILEVRRNYLEAGVEE